jgi:hypothetical protein
VQLGSQQLKGGLAHGSHLLQFLYQNFHGPGAGIDDVWWPRWLILLAWIVRQGCLCCRGISQILWGSAIVIVNASAITPVTVNAPMLNNDGRLLSSSLGVVPWWQ